MSLGLTIKSPHMTACLAPKTIDAIDMAVYTRKQF